MLDAAPGPSPSADWRWDGQGNGESKLMDEGQQRVGVLSEAPQLLREMGADPLQVAAKAGLPLEILRHDENSISGVERGRFYQACVEATGCPHFGLLIGQRGGDCSSGRGGTIDAECAIIRPGYS